MNKISDVSTSNTEFLNRREDCPNHEDQQGYTERILVVAELNEKAINMFILKQVVQLEIQKQQFLVCKNGNRVPEAHGVLPWNWLCFEEKKMEKDECEITQTTYIARQSKER